MTTFYVVTETMLQDGDPNDPTGVIGVYSTRSKAQEAIKNYADDQASYPGEDRPQFATYDAACEWLSEQSHLVKIDEIELDT